MARTWQKGILFVAGVALGAAAGVVGVMALRDGGASHALLATHAMGSGPAPAARAAAAASAVAEVVKLDAGECNLPPILPKKGSDDGQINLDAHPAVGSESEVASVLLTGKEAEASGRQHDAEVAFMNACRNAALVQGNPIPLADAMYQLARHYANSAAFGAQPQKELFDRAERLYSASLLAYQARLGTGNEKTKFAAEGLKTVQQVTGRNGPVTSVAKAPAPAPATVAPPPVAPPAPAPAVAVAPPAPPVAASAPPARAAPAAHVADASPAPARAAPAQVAKAAEPSANGRPAAPQKTPAAVQNTTPPPEPVAPAPQARRTNPSFDCARAHSTNEKLICADEDLARQDRELGRLHARAKQAAADPRAFQRESDAEWASREQTCHDRECLEHWYAKRRAELAAAAAEPVHAPTARHRAPERSESEAMGGPAAPAVPGDGESVSSRVPAPRSVDSQPAPVRPAAPRTTAPRRATDDQSDDASSDAPATETAPGTASGSVGDAR